MNLTVVKMVAEVILWYQRHSNQYLVLYFVRERYLFCIVTHVLPIKVIFTTTNVTEV